MNLLLKIWNFITITFYIVVVSAVVLLALGIILPDNAQRVIEMVKSLFG